MEYIVEMKMLLLNRSNMVQGECLECEAIELHLIETPDGRWNSIETPHIL